MESAKNINLSLAETCCLHCGSPINSGLASTSKFCCKGCEFVFNTLKHLGLGAYYSMHTGTDYPTAMLQNSQAKNYAYFDNLEAQGDFITEVAPNLKKINLYLSSIHCAACIWLLEKLPSILKGVKSARVNFARGEIEVEFNPSIVCPSEIAFTLNSLGYPAVPLNNCSIRKEDLRKERQSMLRIGVAAICAANTMMLSVSLFQGFISGIEEPYASLFKWLSAAIALPAVLYSAFPFYRTAFGALLTGTLHIDLPIAAAIILTYFSGIITTIKHQQYVYFDSVTTLIFFLLVGRFIQSRAVSRARASGLSAWDLLPTSVRVVENTMLVEKPIQDLQIGDLVEVLPGDRIPSDGVVVEGHSALDSSFLTGESLPQAVSTGAAILGGCINLESKLLIQVNKVGANSRIGSILNEIEKSQSMRTALEDRANKLSGYFVFSVFGIALASYLVWSFLDQSRAFDITVAILIVTCPCALGLAIPAAVTVALGRAKKRGIFIRRADAFEALADTEHFYFDKTGTLTSGEISVRETLGTDSKSACIAKSLANFAPLHPVAKSILQYCQGLCKETESTLQLMQPTLLAGRGVQAYLTNGDCVRLGSLRWIQGENVILTAEQSNLVNKWSAEGSSISLLAINTSVITVFALSDSPAPEAAGLVNYLKAKGKEVYILSGDSQGAVSYVARLLGIKSENAIGELFPEQKSAILSRDDKRNCMVGDGLNDAPAMKQSDISIGLRGGIEATIEVAALYISSGHLKELLQLLRASEQTKKVIRNNLIYAVAYNIVGGTIAVLGFVTPLIAAILMPLSSITIVSYSLLSNTFTNSLPKEAIQ